MTCTCCFCLVCCVRESTVAIVTRLGSYSRMLSPGGPYVLNPCLEAIYSTVSLRQMQVPIEVRTKVDKAEVSLTVKVQYRVVNSQEGIRLSQFTLANPIEQISAYVQDVLRSAVSDLTVEQVFDSKDEIGQEVFNTLSEKMKSFGYEILQSLVTDVEPTVAVKQSFDLHNLNRYIKEADNFRQQINTSAKNAISESQRKRDEILGQGISQQRQEIVNGLRASIDEFTQQVTGVSPKDVLELLLITQYFDMLKDIGAAPDSKVIFTPDTSTNTRDAMLQATS
eukprot:snap_masked-scaffold_14-processed-gene-9.20-mRNA-1 protein AED:0.02 eAED:0.02 QI:0/-1/0/1/-1/1/1/0/280